MSTAAVILLASAHSTHTPLPQQQCNSDHRKPVLPYLGLLVWPSMLTLPLLLTSSIAHYSSLFPPAWYDEESRHPLGLTLGISAVAVGHLFVLLYFLLHRSQLLGPTTSIQSRGPTPYTFFTAMTRHLSRPGGFLLLGTYLAMTWINDLLPSSYYSFNGGINYLTVAKCLAVQDFIQYLMHRIEHISHPKLYRISHKPHHKFTNPKIFDAFDGSIPDTAIMILLPLFITAHIVRSANVWTYMAFGSVYANWLALIHSEIMFPWEPVFRRVGLGTAGDHHVHHVFFRWNYGHLFMWWDWGAGTYRSPGEVWGKEFNVGV